MNLGAYVHYAPPMLPFDFASAASRCSRNDGCRGDILESAAALAAERKHSMRDVVCTRPSMTERSGYMLEMLRESGEFTLYRGRQRGNPSPVLAVALAAERPSPQSLRRLEHEYSLAADSVR
jgi:hypothetical protein